MRLLHETPGQHIPPPPASPRRVKPSSLDFRVTVTFADIQAARERIAGAVYHSPCPESIPLSEVTGMRLFCKLENLQRTGSFKERGARNALMLLTPRAGAARRHRGFGGQPRARVDLPRAPAEHPRDGGHAAVRPAGEGQHLPAPRGQRHPARRVLPRSQELRPRPRRGKRLHLHPRLRRPGDHRRPRHDGLGNRRAGARPSTPS